MRRLEGGVFLLLFVAGCTLRKQTPKSTKPETQPKTSRKSCCGGSLKRNSTTQKEKTETFDQLLNNAETQQTIREK
jgi:hypothetical protein